MPIAGLLLLAWVAARPAAAQPAISVFEGVWVPIEAELDGQKFPDNIVKLFKLTVEGDRYTITSGKLVDKGTFKLVPKSKPLAMDLAGSEGPNQGQTFKAIYELKGDLFKIIYALDHGPRPKEFKTAKDSRLFLVTYKKTEG